MNIIVAGATGVIGSRLVPRLVAEGHEVTGLSRDPKRAQDLSVLGAKGEVCDVLDRDRVREVFSVVQPEVVISQVTDLPRTLDPARAMAQFAGNVLVRTEGTRNLVDAARAAGARRIIAQSYAHVYAPEGGWVKSEDDPLNVAADLSLPRQRNADAIRLLEQTVLEASGLEGVALRYGVLYGPGTAYARDGSIARLVRIRHYPIVGGGEGVTSFLHVDDAVDATVLALRGHQGVYNVTDDEPAHVREWLPVYASELGAPAPRHVPAFLVRTLGREHFVFRSTEQRGASNAKIRMAMGFVPAHPTWRAGFDLVEQQIAA